MQEYTIKQVSKQEPKRYEGKYGVTLYHKVRFEGSDEVVEIGRKENHRPKEGDKLYGTIEDTEYGKKFKAERKPFTSSAKPMRDDSAIQAQFAIKTAVAFLEKNDKATLDTVEQYAKDIFAMIGRVKASNSESSNPSLKAQWDKTIEAKNEDKPIPNDKVPLEAYKNIGLDTEVNLDDIPF